MSNKSSASPFYTQACTLIIDSEDVSESAPAPQTLRNILTNNKLSISERKQALSTLIRMIISDKSYDRLFLPVLKFMTSINDHAIKKLLFLYWEVVEKTDARGVFRQEFLLCAEPLRKDLNHSNQFIRGRTLRLIARIPHLDLVEPLIPSVVMNLDHCYHYVRRNAVTCLFSLFSQFGKDTLLSSIDPVEKLLQNQSDLSTKRNAFIYLFCMDRTRALRYLWTLVSNRSLDDPLAEMGGDIFQLSIIQLVRKLCRAEPEQKRHFLKLLQLFASSKSSSVLLECADTLIQLSPLANDIRLAIESYIALLQQQTDNNIKLNVINKLQRLHKHHFKLMQESVLDLIGLLRNVPSFQILKKLLHLICQLSSERNSREVLDMMLGEIRRIQNQQQKSNDEQVFSYKLLLMQQISKHAKQFKGEIFSMAVGAVVKYFVCSSSLKGSKEDDGMMAMVLGQQKSSSPLKTNINGGKSTAKKSDSLKILKLGQEALSFLRMAIECNKSIKQKVIKELCNAITGQISNSKIVLRQTIWMLGEYSDTESFNSVMEAILDAAGELPLKRNTIKSDMKFSNMGSDGQNADAKKMIVKTIIREDGSYGTEMVQQSTHQQSSLQQPGIDSYNKPLRNALVAETPDSYLASLLAVCITKILLKKKKNLMSINNEEQVKEEWSKDELKCILLLCSIAKLIDSASVKQHQKFAHRDRKERILFCIKLLSSTNLAAIEKSTAQIQAIFSNFSSLCKQDEDVDQDVENDDDDGEGQDKNFKYPWEIEKEKLTKNLVENQNQGSEQETIQKTKPDTTIRLRQLERIPLTDNSDNFISSVSGLTSELGMTPLDKVSIGSSSLQNYGYLTQEEQLGAVSLSKFKQSSKEQGQEFVIPSKFHSFTAQNDPIFAQAKLHQGKYALFIEITAKNTTTRTLQDVQFQLFTLGEAKVSDRIHAQTLGAGEYYIRRVSVKIERAQKITVYGFITYSGTRGGSAKVMVLNDLIINFVDKLQKLEGQDLEAGMFKQKWQGFTWEKKIPIDKRVSIKGKNKQNEEEDEKNDKKLVQVDEPLRQFADYLASEIGLNIVEVHCTGKFIVANLLGKSQTGEECLLNMSLRLNEDEKSRRKAEADLSYDIKIGGFIRIRSNKEMLCVSLEEKIKSLLIS